MKPQFIIRISVLSVGIILMMVALLSANSNTFTDIFSLGILLWNILPQIIYFLVTIKVKSYYLLITPALLLFIAQANEVIAIYNSSNSTSGLGFLALPIIAVAAMAIGFLVGYILKELITKRPKQN